MKYQINEYVRPKSGKRIYKILDYVNGDYIVEDVLSKRKKVYSENYIRKVRGFYSNRIINISDDFVITFMDGIKIIPEIEGVNDKLSLLCASVIEKYFYNNKDIYKAIINDIKKASTNYIKKSKKRYDAKSSGKIDSKYNKYLIDYIGYHKWNTFVGFKDGTMTSVKYQKEEAIYENRNQRVYLKNEYSSFAGPLLCVMKKLNIGSFSNISDQLNKYYVNLYESYEIEQRKLLNITNRYIQNVKDVFYTDPNAHYELHKYGDKFYDDYFESKTFSEDLTLEDYKTFISNDINKDRIISAYIPKKEGTVYFIEDINGIYVLSRICKFFDKAIQDIGYCGYSKLILPTIFKKDIEFFKNTHNNNLYYNYTKCLGQYIDEYLRRVVFF